ncbi:hypothetical protein L195_g062294, partial [Trifolium pratense]
GERRRDYGEITKGEDDGETARFRENRDGKTLRELETVILCDSGSDVRPSDPYTCHKKITIGWLSPAYALCIKISLWILTFAC